jgi:ArsR family transcriptional regulator, arsenate/arsenite/antimonite-responsive transcriptional repressor / arsenate reductase (thioredoxin)
VAVSLVPTQPPQLLHLLSHELRWRLVTALARSDYHVQELVRFLGQPQNLVSYHLKRLRSEHLVTERRSTADRRDVYYSLDLDRLRELYLSTGEAIHPGLGPVSPEWETEARQTNRTPTRVLFLCTQNSARSQLAEGILRHLGGDRVEVFSAGSEPSSIHPEAVRVLSSLGIVASPQQAKHLDLYRGQHFDYLITVCDRVRETCPAFPGDPERIHWSFPDPVLVEDEEARRRAFDQTTQQLITRIRYLLTLVERSQRQ